MPGKITGWGMYIPGTRVTNAELIDTFRYVDESNAVRTTESIERLTGIRERAIAIPPESLITMSVKAIEQALAVAGIDKADVTGLYVANGISTFQAPPLAAAIQHYAGLPVNYPAKTINGNCAGFIDALEIAVDHMASDPHREHNILVGGVEVLSMAQNYNDPRSEAFLFGDGAGFVLLSSSKEQGILSAKAVTDSSGYNLQILNNIPVVKHYGGDVIDYLRTFVRHAPETLCMDGGKVFRWAVKKIPELVDNAVQDAGLMQKDISYVVCHQANARIIDFAKRELERRGYNAEFPVTIHMTGNTSAASIPITLASLLDTNQRKNILGEHKKLVQRMPQSGDYIALVGFGGGLTYGTAIMRL